VHEPVDHRGGDDIVTQDLAPAGSVRVLRARPRAGHRAGLLKAGDPMGGGLKSHAVAGETGADRERYRNVSCRSWGNDDGIAMVFASDRMRELASRGRALVPAFLASHLAEDREATLLGEAIHCVLDRGFHFEVDRVDVLAIIDPLWVVVEVNRVEQLGADLRW
jgi:hypothetical protein